jgi:four helix bundle protein
MTGRGVVRTFRDLVVWQRAFELVVAVYRASEALPVQERYALTAELRKTARSIAYNIAEGHRRTSTTQYMRFLDIARGSAAELETQFLLGHALGYLEEKVWAALLDRLGDVDRMLGAFSESCEIAALEPLDFPLRVPVGTALSGGPPDRTRRADFPHRAPTSGQRSAKRRSGHG